MCKPLLTMKDGLLFSGCDSIAGYLLWHYESMSVDTNPARFVAFSGQIIPVSVVCCLLMTKIQYAIE
jgi:hypothetical protein